VPRSALKRVHTRAETQTDDGKLSLEGFARAFRLREDAFLHKLLCLWDRNAVRCWAPVS
jgi:hypothetical protein